MRNKSTQMGVTQAVRLFTAASLLALVTACSPMSLFTKEPLAEAIVPVEQLYSSATQNMEKNNYLTAIAELQKIERQHPYSDYNERSKVLMTFANFRIGKYRDAVLAADRFLALYPQSKEVPYVLFLKGSSYYKQITDITRDQELAKDAFATLKQLVDNYPNSEYAREAKPMMDIANDQQAGKEMSVGRYYLGQSNYIAAINRFREVVEGYQTSTHVEEALYRLTESYLRLGLVSEAQTAAAVLGHNYPNSNWYKSAFDSLAKLGISPQMNAGNWLSTRAKN